MDIKDFLQKTIRKLKSGRKYAFSRLKGLSSKQRTWSAFSVVSLAVLATAVYNLVGGAPYQLSQEARQLIDEPHGFLASSLEHDSGSGKFEYNQNYRPRPGAAGQDAGPKFSASFDTGSNLDTTVRDAATDATLTFEPRYDLDQPHQDQNRLIYPLGSIDGAKVVSLKTVGFKEDIIINRYQDDELSFEYELGLPEGAEARLESDGSVAVYGVNSALLGEVAASSEADQQLLDKARQNSDKQKLLFTIPAPFVKEAGKPTSEVETYFSLEDDNLTIHAEGLKEADYPLSIDPSIYVESATEMMRGNPETNVDFDVDSGLIKKGSLSGASFDSWSSTAALNQSIWNGSTAAAGGYIYSVGGNDGTNTLNDVYWAKPHTTNHMVTSPNPGAGACSNWCTDTDYSLPEAREGHSLVAYNGYLYVMGGIDSSGTRSNHVYIAKLGSNGEPRLWHPTSTNKTDWVYWYQDTNTNLSSERSYHAAVGYKNRLYVLGGQTDTDSSGITTIEYADIDPDGTFGSWSTSGMSTLPQDAGKHYHAAEVYNDRLYVIGGVVGTVTTGNIVGNVFYAKLDDGTSSDWTETSTLSSPRMSWGGDFATVEDGHIYQAGGCSAVNEEDTEAGIPEGTYCTSIEQTTQFTSINADGSLATWKTVSGGDAPYIGHDLLSWNGALYRLGGCSVQDNTTGDCTTVHSEVDYTPINTAGDISEVSLSSTSGSGNCSGSDPYDCDLPPPGDSAGQGGQMLTASVIVNGYLYVIGGCANTGCTDVSGNVSYTEIASDGTLAMPETCIDNYYGAWCVDNTNRVNGTDGVAAAGVATFNNSIYLVGGLDGSSNTNAIYRNSTEDDGSLSGSWTSQDLSGGSGVGAADLAYTFAHARANPATAGTNPGNLFMFGGCNATSAADCTGSLTNAVYKCDIQSDGAITGCTTSGQLQIDAATGASGSGLALHSGAVYADYIYLVGGAAPGQADLDTVRYAMLDDNNDVVAASGSQWIESASTLSTGREAGYSFTHNGYLYTAGGFNGGSSTVQEDVEFARINPADGSLEPFSTSSTTIDPRWGFNTAVSSSRAYILGGCGSGAGTGSCSDMDESVRTVKIHNNESGSPATYEAADNLFDTDRIAASSVIHDGYIYIAGGCTDSATCDAVTNDVQYAPLDALGNVGSWSSATAALPADRAWGQLEAVGGTLYYIGGQDGATSASASADIFYATPSSGDINSWSTTTNGVPAARTQHSSAVWDDRIYITGGVDASDNVQDTVYISPQLSSGGDITGSWSTSNAFDVARSGHTVMAYANNLYVLGGYDGDNYLSDVQFASLNTDGSVGDWSFTSDLPMPIRQGDGFVANGYIYLFGGRSSEDEESCRDRTLVAPINANTAVTDGNDATGIGDWFEANSLFGGKRFGIAASYHDGKAYLVGGGCAQLLNRSETYSTPGEHTFTSPEDTTQVVVEAWGGGGGGGSGENGGNNAAGAGGGAGGYARHTMPVSPGDYTVMVGAGGAGGAVGAPGDGVNNPGTDGDGSWFDSDTTVFAAGGGGAGFGTSVGTGGSANIGSDATFNGGGGGSGHASANPSNRRGGGGGGSGFHDADGGDGADGTGQAGSGSGGTGTGNGGDGGVDTNDGFVGDDPGGAGGGGGYRGSGGDGADGRIIVHYQEWSPLVLTGSDRVSVGALLSQPQVADYSYIVDTDTDVFPYAWLMNGNDSFSPADWQLDYLSSTSSTSTWGQETSFDAVDLGQPGSYTPLDSSGDDTNFARYYYFSVSVDQTHTYGYPNEAVREPTVNNLSLFFTADPLRRLRHGKTFLDGGLQPLNTPF